MNVPTLVVRFLAAVLFFMIGLRSQDAGGGRQAANDARAAADTGRAVTLRLPASLEHERRAYEREVSSAIGEVLDFFRASGLEVPAGGNIESVLVFRSAAGAREHLAGIYGIPLGDIPPTFSGTVDGSTLFLVSRESYEETWRSLYGGWPWSEATYRGLIVHELAHKAHEAIAIARCGSPEAMGPTWFFEGLAVACAGQFIPAGPPMSPEEIRLAAGSGRTPEPSYPLYGRLFRSLAARFPLRDLVDGASDREFPEMLWRGRSVPPPGEQR